MHQYCTPLTSLSFVADAWCPDDYHRSPDGDCERVPSVDASVDERSEADNGNDEIGQMKNIMTKLKLIVLLVVVEFRSFKPVNAKVRLIVSEVRLPR
ncbi:MAG: hypothetical protein GEU26_04755 [Nitrososphaeraceae archaeon]|nr:hypothetical protein [Nitrososphaeraceae archaeon]